MAEHDAIAGLGEYLEKARRRRTGGPFIGPRGGKWADPQHKIPWDPKKHGKPEQLGLFGAEPEPKAPPPSAPGLWKPAEPAVDAAKRLGSAALVRFLEKYTPTQLDAIMDEIQAKDRELGGNVAMRLKTAAEKVRAKREAPPPKPAAPPKLTIEKDPSGYYLKWRVMHEGKMLIRYKRKGDAQAHIDILQGDLSKAPALYRRRYKDALQKMSPTEAAQSAALWAKQIGLSPDQVKANPETGEPHETPEAAPAAAANIAAAKGIMDHVGQFQSFPDIGAVNRLATKLSPGELGQLQDILDEGIFEAGASGGRVPPHLKKWQTTLKRAKSTAENPDSAHRERVERFQARQEAKRERKARRAEKLRAEADAARKQEQQIGSAIPFGQPVLVGHHSERKHRRDIERMNKLTRKQVEASREASRLEDQLARPSTAILSDDPEAIQKLQAQIDQAEQMREKYKQINKVARKKGMTPEKLAEQTGLKVTTAVELLNPQFGKKGIPGYRLTNIGANIRRMKQRIESLRAEAEREPAAPIEGRGFRIEEDPDDNRIRFYFDTRPDRETHKKMRSAGFVFSRRNGAYQRQLNNAGRYAAERMAKELFPQDEPIEQKAPPTREQLAAEEIARTREPMRSAPALSTGDVDVDQVHRELVKYNRTVANTAWTPDQIATYTGIPRQHLDGVIARLVMDGKLDPVPENPGWYTTATTEKSMRRTDFENLADYLEHEELVKAQGHKYIRREGGPGNYRYIYETPSGERRTLRGQRAEAAVKEHYKRPGQKPEPTAADRVVDRVKTKFDEYRAGGMTEVTMNQLIADSGLTRYQTVEALNRLGHDVTVDQKHMNTKVVFGQSEQGGKLTAGGKYRKWEFGSQKEAQQHGRKLMAERGLREQDIGIGYGEDKWTVSIPSDPSQEKSMDALHQLGDYFEKKQIRGTPIGGTTPSGKYVRTGEKEYTPIDEYKMGVRGEGHKEVAAKVKEGVERAADICKVSPPVCKGNLGLPRSKMPQIGGDVEKKFLDHYREKGVKVENTTKAVGQLKATQKEINAKKAAGMAHSFKNKLPDPRTGKPFDPRKGGILVSKDGHILDGHHRFAAALMVDPGAQMEVTIIDVPIKQLLKDALDFPGVTRAGFDAPSTKSMDDLRTWSDEGGYLYSMSKAACEKCEHVAKCGKSMEKCILKADDGKPGESLSETSTEELTATHNDLMARLKAKPGDQAMQTRHDAIRAELKRRGKDPMGKAMPSEEASVSPEKARQILRDGEVHGKPLTEKQRGMFGAIAGKARKSMSGIDSLAEYLAKADTSTTSPQPNAGESGGISGDNAAGAGGLPHNETNFTERSREDGGPLDAVGKQHNKTGPAGFAHPASGSPGEKLSADDVVAEQQMSPAGPGEFREGQQTMMGRWKKSDDGGSYTQQELEHTVAHERAVREAQLRAGEPDLVVKGGKKIEIEIEGDDEDEEENGNGEKLSKPGFQASMNKAQTFRHGDLVEYSDASDRAVEALDKSGDGFYHGAPPAIDATGTLRKSVACPNGHAMPASLTSCPSCGDGMTHNIPAGAGVHEIAPQLLKSGRGLVPAYEPDLVLPNGTIVDDDE